MKLRKITATAAIAAVMVGGATAAAEPGLDPGPALTGTSDAATPYQVTGQGIQLPAGDTFQAHGHVNIR